MTNKDDRKEFEAHKVTQSLALGADKETFKNSVEYLLKLDKFDYKNGFPKKNSDLVGNYRMTLNENNQLYYDFRVSEEFDLN